MTWSYSDIREPGIRSWAWTVLGSGGTVGSSREATSQVGVVMARKLGVPEALTDWLAQARAKNPAPVPGAAKQSETTSLGIDGIIIVRTLPGSPAANAGIEGATADGVIRDVITEANGKPIHSMEELTSTLEDAGIGKQVTLTVERNGQSRDVKLTVADVSQLSQG